MTDRQDFIVSTGLPLDINLLKPASEAGGDRYFAKDDDAANADIVNDIVSAALQPVNTNITAINNTLASQQTAVVANTNTISSMGNDVADIKAAAPNSSRLPINIPAFTSDGTWQPIVITSIDNYNVIKMLDFSGARIAVPNGVYVVSVKLDGDIVGNSPFSSLRVQMKRASDNKTDDIGFSEVGAKVRGVHLYNSTVHHLSGDYDFTFKTVAGDDVGNITGAITLMRVI